MSLLAEHLKVEDYWQDQNGYWYYDPGYYAPDNYYDSNSGWDDFTWNDAAEGLPEYNPDKDLAGDENWEDWVYYFRYIINVWIIAVPYTIVGLAAVVYNLYFNIDWNKMWSGGNAWLITNSVYLILMYIVSVLEAFELPVFLSAFKVVRTIAFISAWMYVISFIVGAAEWANMLYVVQDKSGYDFGTVYINMLLGYNIVLHFEIIPVCLFVIFKEITMEFFEFLSPTNSEALSTNDLETTGEDFLWFINPFTWLDMWSELIFGSDVEDDLNLGWNKSDYIYN